MLISVYIFLFVLLLLLTVQHSSGLKCGLINLNAAPWSSRPTRLPRKILGGRKITESNSMPWLIILNSETLLCTGSLIAPNYVLTARHCSEDIQKLPLNRTVVGYGNVERNQVRETKVVEIFDHPSADIAVLKLKYSIYQTPVCLPERYNADCRLEKDMVIAGFGLHLDEDFDPGLKRNGSLIVRPMPESLTKSALWTKMEQLDRVKCALPSLPKSKNIQSYEFCAGGLGRGSRDGDSGGPVMKVVGNRVIQVGVTARGFSRAVNHRVYDLGIYVNVGDHAKWIAETTNKTAQFLRIYDPCNVY